MSKRGLKRRQFDQAADLTEASTKNYFILFFYFLTPSFLQTLVLKNQFTEKPDFFFLCLRIVQNSTKMCTNTFVYFKVSRR